MGSILDTFIARYYDPGLFHPIAHLLDGQTPHKLFAWRSNCHKTFFLEELWWCSFQRRKHSCLRNATCPVSKGMFWAGWVLAPCLPCPVRGRVMKLIKPAVVVEATVQLGYPESVILASIVLLACTIPYAIPRN